MNFSQCGLVIKCSSCPFGYHSSDQVARRKRHHHGPDPGDESPSKKEKAGKTQVITKKGQKDSNNVFYVDNNGRIKQSEKHETFKSEYLHLLQDDSQTETETKEPDYLPGVDEDVPEQSQPDKFNKDPLKGFFLQTVLECKECPERPTRKFAYFNSWQIHMKSQHKDLSSITLYKVM